MKTFSITRLETIEGTTFIYGYYTNENSNRLISCTIKINALGVVLLTENKSGMVLNTDDCLLISEALTKMSIMYEITANRIILNNINPIIFDNNEYF